MWVELLLTALTGIVATAAYWFYKRFKDWVAAKLTDKERSELENWVRVAVEAAEQLAKNGELFKIGADKFKYVQSFVRDLGVDIEDWRLQLLIESAVFEMKGGTKI